MQGNGREENATKKKVARDLVKLKHVEVNAHRQTPDLSEALKFQQYNQRPQLPELQTIILQAFQKKRMILTNLMITINQSRKIMGLPQISAEQMKEELARLEQKGYVTHQVVEYDGVTNDVYVLTEAGEEFVMF